MRPVSRKRAILVGLAGGEIFVLFLLVVAMASDGTFNPFALFLGLAVTFPGMALAAYVLYRIMPRFPNIRWTDGEGEPEGKPSKDGSGLDKEIR